MAKFVHSMIRVLDEARSVAFYDRAFGLEVAERLDFDEFTLIYLSNPESSFELELTVNKAQTEPYAPGTGYGHAAFVVEDVDAEHARFQDLGLAPRKLVDLTHQGQVKARFFFVQDPDGYMIEVIGRGGRFG
ncbi:lactoylglutathione lyase [Paracoccus liaowanqingii]|uniref:Lactoylglutathione lyase n=1 Tax=Paracoccus liaowanqingii TaxID=2560053 RepID=A0A4Z1C1G2_9RHOB|nr:VOC family protein [Paracoccus liaowanqingii]QDA35981.1 lactoylglutathione lyase [Paracoccus liaowanqingii]TGN62476.1 lactoylglutathione lyase [Paracoccus liaowanqingii]